MKANPENLPRNQKLKPYATKLRNKMTKEERHLWYDFLKGQPSQFNRQRIIGNYIVDFYCDKQKLVIEIDGAEHYQEQAKEYDQQRTEYLETLGLTVIRFTNREIQTQFDAVCSRIEQFLLR